MSLLTSKDEYGGYLGSLCHVCGDAFNNENIVEHSGDVLLIPHAEGHGVIVMHEECATILALRLIADVMRVSSKNERVVDKLKRKK